MDLKLNELAKIKAELLCFGVRLDESAEENGTIKNSYLLDGGFVHAAHFLIGDIVVNTCVSEEFCKTSPYTISWNNDRYVLTKNDSFICNIDILELPDWCRKTVNGRVIGDYLRPHSPGCISCCPKLRCTYYKDGQQCKFCSLGDRADSNEFDCVLPAADVAEMVKIALQYNPDYEIALSGGTCSSDDKSAVYFSEICRQIINNRKNKYDISVELAPPDDDKYIEQLYESGATSIIMNIEIADEEKRHEICPGKSNIPLSRYFSAMEKAVKIFGKGKVSSVLIAGIEEVDKNDIINVCKKIIPMGVIPTIIPFKPLDGSLMSNHAIADPEEVLNIAYDVNQMLYNEKLIADKQGACTKCGGCSLESVFQLAY